MKQVNILLTLLSLNAVLVIVERVSPTARIILQPYNFLRVHEVVQMTVIIMVSMIINFFLLKTLTQNFETLKSKKGALLGIFFILGIYFTATGNGLHEVASHLFNTYCDTKHFRSDVCGSMFFNDYYVGNILYFVGLFLGTLSLILLEKMKPFNPPTPKQVAVTVANGILYGLMLTAYAAFDRVLVGFAFVAVSAAITGYLLLSSKTKFTTLPFTLYSSVAYTLSAVLTVLIRFR